MTDALLVMDDATVAYGESVVLDGMSLSAQAGETIGIIGPNGAGKTSTLNAIGGLVRLRRGTVHMAGLRLDRMRPDAVVRHGIGRSFQSTEYFKNLTPTQLVELASAGPRNRRNAGGDGGVPIRAAQVLEMFDLLDSASTRLVDLPNGLQKRADMARATVSGTRILLLDEPTSGLSAAERPGVEAILRQIHSPDRLVIMVDHDPAFVARNCDRVVAMNFGKCLASGNPDAVLRSPEVRESYLGAEADDVLRAT
jgi:branched-chain amino acid transport system ATP-binding protein